MPMPRLAPTPAELKSYLDRGWTHAEIAEHTGLPRSTISSAVRRAGLSDEKPRYKDEIPWKVREQHARHYAARMLRLLGRRRAGGSLSEIEVRHLESWLKTLEEMHAVVLYDGETEDGFFYVDGDPLPSGIPIVRAS